MPRYGLVIAANLKTQVNFILSSLNASGIIMLTGFKIWNALYADWIIWDFQWIWFLIPYLHWLRRPERKGFALSTEGISAIKEAASRRAVALCFGGWFSTAICWQTRFDKTRFCAGRRQRGDTRLHSIWECVADILTHWKAQKDITRGKLRVEHCTWSRAKSVWPLRSYRFTVSLYAMA